MSTDKYYQQAQQQYDPAYNQKVQNYKNQLAQNQLAVDQQKTGINANYDMQVQNQQRNNQLLRNSISNQMLGRGLANSSIAISGLEQQNAQNARLVGQINAERTGALNDLEAQKALLAQNTNNTLAQMAADRENEIRALAMQLEDRQWEKDFKEKGQQLEQDKFTYQKEYNDKMMAMQQQAQEYEQKYKDTMVRLQEEKQKFDMGYQNRYLEMQQKAQEYEQKYKDASLQLQREQMNAETSYKYAALAQQRELQEAQMAWEREQASAKGNNVDKNVVDYINAYGAIIGDGTKTYDEKKNLLRGLAGQVDNYGAYTGTDLSGLLGNINQHATNYTGFTERPWIGSSNAIISPTNKKK